MELLTKAVPAYGVKILDEEKGIVEAIVSVTGNVDDGGDVIMPGAYAKTLKERTPKGVHGHSWREAVAKALEVEEYLPGDERLYAMLSDDQRKAFSAGNWGGLYVKGQYNLETQRGREAYADVKFYGPAQEWSIGYSTGPGDTKKRKNGDREIHNLALYEWSDVLFGMNPATVTGAVKALSTKAFVVVSDSYEDVRRRIQETLHDWAHQMVQGTAYAYVEATFDDRVIVSLSWFTDDDYRQVFYQVPYTLAGDSVTFGEAAEVAIEGVVVPKSAEEAKARNLVLAQRSFGLDPSDLLPAEKETDVQPPPVGDPAQSPDAPEAVPGTEVPVEVVPNTPREIPIEDDEKGLRIDPLVAEFEALKLSA